MPWRLQTGVSGSGFEFWAGCVRQRPKAYLLLAVSPLEAEWGGNMEISKTNPRNIREKIQ